MENLSDFSSKKRRARSRSLIQLGGLLEKAGILDVFEITLGEDLQTSPDMKLPIAALFKGLLTLKEEAMSENVNLQLWAVQGLEALASQNIKNDKYKNTFLRG